MTYDTIQAEYKKLRELALDLNISASNAAGLLKTVGGCPAEGQSLDQHVARMKKFLEDTK